MTEFRFFRKLTSTTCQQQACQVKNSEKVTSRVFDKGRSKEQMTVPTMNDLWWLFSYFCFVYSCCHFEQPQPWAGFVHEFSPRCLLVVVQLGCAMSGILQHIHFSCAEWGRHLDVGGIDAWCNRFDLREILQNDVVLQVFKLLLRTNLIVLHPSPWLAVPGPCGPVQCFALLLIL